MQDYKLVLRTLTGGQSVLNDDGSIAAQNASEFMTYLNEQYLSQGYTIHTISLLKPIDVGARFYEFAYHLVKEVATKGK